MRRGKEMAEWNRLSHLLATIINTVSGAVAGDKAEWVEPWQFNPWLTRQDKHHLQSRKTDRANKSWHDAKLVAARGGHYQLPSTDSTTGMTTDSDQDYKNN